ncbi:hypothetical protein D0T66_09195 [Dysgonomonas sp. 25]|nr:hypothetical protein [Dysgonomonas sp. 25]
MDKAVRKQRRNTQIIVAVVAAVMGAFFLIRGNTFSGIVLLLCAVPSYFLCAFYAKLLYKFSLRNHVAALYRKSTPRDVSLRIINEETIDYHERGLGQQVRIADLEEISDVKEYIYLKLGNTSYIIIPKATLSDPDYVEDKLRHYAARYDVPFIYNPQWKWR